MDQEHLGLRIVPAQPAATQVRHFYQLSQMASDDLYTGLFGARASTVLQSMFVRADNDFSYENTRFLALDEDYVGMLHAYPARYTKAHVWRNLWLLLRYAGLEVFRFMAAAIALRDIFAFMEQHLNSTDFYIAMLAVYPSYRGCGYSKALLAQANHLAAVQACERLALDVDEGNAIARAAYLKAGFEQVAESMLVQLGGESLRVLRMAKPVTAEV